MPRSVTVYEGVFEDDIGVGEVSDSLKVGLGVYDNFSYLNTPARPALRAAEYEAMNRYLRARNSLLYRELTRLAVNPNRYDIAEDFCARPIVDGVEAVLGYMHFEVEARPVQIMCVHDEKTEKNHVSIIGALDASNVFVYFLSGQFFIDWNAVACERYCAPTIPPRKWECVFDVDEKYTGYAASKECIERARPFSREALHAQIEKYLSTEGVTRRRYSFNPPDQRGNEDCALFEAEHHWVLAHYGERNETWLLGAFFDVRVAVIALVVHLKNLNIIAPGTVPYG